MEKAQALGQQFCCGNASLGTVGALEKDTSKTSCQRQGQEAAWPHLWGRTRVITLTDTGRFHD